MKDLNVDLTLDEMTALARRWYMHLLSGASLQPHDMSILVQWLEKRGLTEMLLTRLAVIQEARKKNEKHLLPSALREEKKKGA